MDKDHASDPAERSLTSIGMNSWQYLPMSPRKQHQPQIMFSACLKSETGSVYEWR